MNLLVPAAFPFRFHSVVTSHGWSRLAPFVWNAETGELQRTELLGTGRVVVYRMSDAGNGIAVKVEGRLTRSEQRELEAKIAWMFSLDLNLQEFYAAVQHEPRLKHVRRESHGRFLRSATVWEDVVKVMMTTNIQWSGTIRLTRVLVDAFGQPYEGKGEPLNAFPLPQVIARTRESRLRKLGLGYRAPYLLQLARGVVAGEYDLDALRDPAMDIEDLRKRLLALPGIGPYAAATLMMIFGRYDYLGVDTEALSAVSKGLYEGKPVGEKEVQAAFAQWGKYKALAYWFWNWDESATS